MHPINRKGSQLSGHSSTHTVVGDGWPAVSPPDFMLRSLSHRRVCVCVDPSVATRTYRTHCPVVVLMPTSWKPVSHPFGSLVKVTSLDYAKSS